MRVTVGIYLETEPWRLRTSLDSLRADLEDGVEVLLLPDGPDAAMSRALEDVRHLPRSATADPRGAAACFNRLIGTSDAEVAILLEAGCRVGPGWLRHLLAALEAGPRNGLAGPSTNRAWNEQGAFPRAGDRTEDVARTALEAARRFGTAARTLEPLHSLGDFCYAVRREVVEAVGAAGEDYGLGPCWEMDYNIRAARAGFHGVWAGAAYVHRPPFTARRRRHERRSFAASRRLYQERFCGLHLRGEAQGYEPHCRGEECEHFAPPDLIRVHLPLAPLSSASLLNPVRRSPGRSGPRPAEDEQPVEPRPPVSGLPPPARQPPMISCIMPTRGRPDYVLRSVRYFERQDYPQRELIILGDGEDDLTGVLPEDPRIRYLHSPRSLSIGAKRNLGIVESSGEILAHWDDDDWYAPGRLSAQVAPLLAGEAEISGLEAGIFFHLDRWDFWRTTPELHRRLFVGDVHGGTLVYRRRVTRWAHYPDCSLAEDAAFLRLAMRRGARLARLENDNLFIYLRHGTNSWSFRCGHYLDPRGWRQVEEPCLPAQDRAFYAARSAALVRYRGPGARPPRAPGKPLVSCLMPTADRRRFVPQAIRYFLRQDYPRRELIILDDGTDAVGDLVPTDPRIRYLRQEQRLSLGAKRNLTCDQARGEILVHWDDDDWHAPWRLSYQVGELLDSGAELCGLDQLWFFDPAADRAWRYVYPPGRRKWLAGGTLCFRRAFWQRHPFPEITIGEDTRFVGSAASERIKALDDDGFYVALIHSQNTSRKRPAGRRWRPASGCEVRTVLGSDRDFYRDLCSHQ